MLAAGWDLRWGHQPEHPHMASPCGRASSQHGSLRVTGLFTWWLRAPKHPMVLPHHKEGIDYVSRAFHIR